MGKKISQFIIRIQRGKRRLPFKWEKQRAGKTSIQVGQGDQHIVSPRPDMQSIFFNFKLSIFPRRKGKFFIPEIYIVLFILKAVMLQLQLKSNGGVSSVGAE